MIQLIRNQIQRARKFIIDTNETRIQARQWFYRLVIGLSHSLELHLTWLRIYTCWIAVLYFASCASNLIAFSILNAVFITVSLVLLQWGIVWTQRKYYYNSRRIFARSFAILFGLISLIAISVPAIELLRYLAQGTSFEISLLYAIAVWFVATIIVGIVAIFLGTAFNADFVPIRRTVLRHLPFLSGIFLALVAAQDLLFWPQSSSQILKSFDFFTWVVSASNTRTIISTEFLFVAGFLLVFSAIAFTAYAIYFKLASRLREGTKLRLNYAVQLLRRNLKTRIKTGNGTVWPTSPKTHKHDEVVKLGTSVEEFTLAYSISAISLTFGLWVPRLADAAGNVNSFVFLVLVFFLAGGIDTSLVTIDLVSSRGTGYTLGSWLGSAFVYWLTTLLVVVCIVVVLNYSEAVSRNSGLALQNNFTVIFRTTVGVLTLFMALIQVMQARLRSDFRILRFGLAIVVLLLLLGYAAQANTNAQSSDIALIYAAIASCGMAYTWNALRLALSKASVNPLRAKLVCSSSIAIAPLVMNLEERVRSIEWLDPAIVELSINMGANTRDPFPLRVALTGSEEETAYEALRSLSGTRNEWADFVITDLNTAIDLIGTRADQISRSNPGNAQKVNYRIACVVGIIPWRKITIPAAATTRTSKPIKFILDAGFLPYSPAFPSERDQHHPIDSTRPASFVTIAEYSLRNAGDIMEVQVAEPYASWISRRISKEYDTVPDQIAADCVYVLLTLSNELNTTMGRAAVPFDWRRVLCEMITVGQLVLDDAKAVINHSKLHQLHDFMQQATKNRLDLSIEDLQAAICKSTFSPVFPPETGNFYPQIFKRLERNQLIEYEQCVETDEDSNTKYIAIDGKNSKFEEILKKCSRLVAVTQRVKYSLIDEEVFGKFAVPLKGSDEVDPYLVSIAAIHIADKPTQLRKLLAVVSNDIDISMIATVNLGDTAIVYLVDKTSLPNFSEMEGVSTGLLRNNAQEWDKTKWLVWLSSWKSKTKVGVLDAVELQAFVIGVKHEQGQLLSSLQGIRETFNIEQIFVFPVQSKLAIALVILKRDSWSTFLHSYSSSNAASAFSQDI